MAESNYFCVAAAMEGGMSLLTEDEQSELLVIVTVLGSTMESIFNIMRREVTEALERETNTKMHSRIVYALTQNQLACLREPARERRDENEAWLCAEALEDQDTQLAAALVAESFPSLEQERQNRVMTRSTPTIREEMERVGKGLRRLVDAMDAGDIKRVRVHHRAMMSDLSYVKGIIRAAAEREGWSEQQVSELFESVRARVAGAIERAEQMLTEADVQAKKEWADWFLEAAKRVQGLAAHAHQYLTPEDWTMRRC